MRKTIALLLIITFIITSLLLFVYVKNHDTILSRAKLDFMHDPTGNATVSEAIAKAANTNSMHNGSDGTIPPSNQINTYSKLIVTDELQEKDNTNKNPDVSVEASSKHNDATVQKADVIVKEDEQSDSKLDTKTTRTEASTIPDKIIDQDKSQTVVSNLPKTQNAFEQLMATGKYVKGTGKIYSQGDCLFYNDAYPNLSDNGIRDNLKWYIFIDPAGGPTYDTKNYECEIILTKWNFDLASRRQVRDALKILYPDGYIQVYDCMMKALNFDLWEAGRMNTLNATSGTMWTRYADGRAINVQFQYDIGAVRIYLYKVGYTQAPPEQESAAGIKAETEIAKDFGGWKSAYESYQLGTY